MRRKVESTEDQNLFIGRLNKMIRHAEDKPDPVKSMNKMLKECRAAIWTQQNAIDALQEEVKSLYREREEFIKIFDDMTAMSNTVRGKDASNEHSRVSETKWDIYTSKRRQPKSTLSKVQRDEEKQTG